LQGMQVCENKGKKGKERRTRLVLRKSRSVALIDEGQIARKRGDWRRQDSEEVNLENNEQRIGLCT